MRQLACITSLFVLFVIGVYANTEKVIFLAPAAINLPETLKNLQLDVLTLSAFSLRKSLPVSFPTEEQPQGEESWYLLRTLKDGQRYEVRICWAAIQPTNFEIDVFDVDRVLNIPQLVERIPLGQHQHQTLDVAPIDQAESILFLRVWSAAAFFTTNKTLMQSPPPVDVDIILDPYLANVFPKSLLPTAAYIICLAVSSWYASGIIWKVLSPTAAAGEKVHKD